MVVRRRQGGFPSQYERCSGTAQSLGNIHRAIRQKSTPERRPMSLPGSSPPTRSGRLAEAVLLIVVPLAALAAWVGISVASLPGLDRHGWGAALNKAALVSLSFTALMAGFGIGYALMGAAI